MVCTATERRSSCYRMSTTITPDYSRKLVMTRSHRGAMRFLYSSFNRASVDQKTRQFVTVENVDQQADVRVPAAGDTDHCVAIRKPSVPYRFRTLV